ncbi:MAG: hypothetical protein P8I35_06540 [Flavobacteriaceae bacterium]|nr:hypothetical protein [Flavobacteriaceae bacterium]
MSKKVIPYIYILFFGCFSCGMVGQNLVLKITSVDPLQNHVLNAITFKKNHNLETDIYKEITNIHSDLKKEGFFVAIVDTIIKDAEKYEAVFNLGKKTDNLILILPQEIRTNSSIKYNDSIRIKTKGFENFTNLLLTNLDATGNSFSEISFTKPTYLNDTLILNLKLLKSQRRNIDKILVKGYDEFPKKFLKHFFNIDKSTVFSKKNMKAVSKLTKSLDFVREKKEPEVLFKKDSTHLYLFLEKSETSSFDGIINFASKENEEGLLLNGNLDLKLNNVLNTGEKFELFWNKVAQEKSEFKITSAIPYIFNTPLSIALGFNLYRQDSTFINTRFNLDSQYLLNTRSKASISYSSEKSSYLLTTAENNFDSYSNYFIGIGYQLRSLSDTYLFKNNYSIALSSKLGKRKNEISDQTQVQLEVLAFLNIQTNKKSYIHIKSESKLLSSENYLINELYRIGGANSIRGVNEQSIFTNTYSLASIEFRYLTSTTAYLYSITDVGYYKNSITDKLNNAYGLGGGYRFKLNNNFVDLGYVIGNNSNNQLKLNKSKLIIKWTSYF